ncbi:hypothetical protein [Streptomyces sp. NRRL F-5527]|uniref:hypothetical protein n=1 Tax=Streptomyces sp. NRRL F-5527 TaxID=1463862 RepID=UPI0004CA6AB7|nr:hypothetical protein [Streptomyces sp. NRRL F-5527]
MTEKADLQPVLDRAAAGGRITPEEALVLYRDAPLHALGAAADAVRRRRYAGTEHIATYIIERNINYTNVCVTACKFCAFYAAPKDTKKGWTRDLDDILRRCAETVELGGTQIIAPLKESGERWLEIMEIAHNLGVESTSTMLMGTGETNAERIEHLRMIRDVQDRTGGFRAFIPYTYQPENNHLKGRTQATLFEYLRIGQLSLHYGADDLGSIMLEENVVSSAGAKHRSNRLEIIDLIRKAGRVPAQRSTTYEHLVVHDDPANDPVDDRVVSHISSTAIEGGTAHPELKLLPAN